YETIQQQMHDRLIQEMYDTNDPILTYLYPKIGLSINSIDHWVHVNTDLPNDTFTVTNYGIDTLNYTITDDASWFSCNPDNGSSSGESDTINIIYHTAGLAIGDYSATISVADPNAMNTPQQITVEIQVRQPGDLDHDYDVDQEDFGFFQACYSGLGQTFPPGCEEADMDSDTDVDRIDFNNFYPCMAGPNQTPGC
ncbi:MAG: hypothetical protein JSV03_16235, partial [Planctomycetota bacterium]